MNKQQIQCYTLKSDTGIELTVLNLGARIVGLKVPSAKGMIDVVLSYSNICDYVTDRFYLGATIGRYANRINNASYRYAKQKVSLNANEGKNQLHGGEQGFDRQYWHIETPKKQDVQQLVMSLFSPHGDQGFVGNLKCQVIFSVKNNCVIIDYLATTDQATPVNLTNHSYFNLDGDASLIDQHYFYINSDEYTPVNAKNIPTKEILTVDNTAFDFRQNRQLVNAEITNKNKHNQRSSFDHNYLIKPNINGDKLTASLLEILPKNIDKKLNFTASASSKKSGLIMNFYCTKPGMQFYTSDYLESPLKARQGFCFEPQFYPDSPNNPHFPDCFLREGKQYNHRQVFEFIT